MVKFYRQNLLCERNFIMRSELSEYEKVEFVIKKFVEGVKKGSSKIMMPCFHKDAVLFGKFNDDVIQAGSIKPAFSGIDTGGPCDEDYAARIDILSLEKSVAIVRLIEDNWRGCKLTNFFTLWKQNNDWKIIAVAYDVL